MPYFQPSTQRAQISEGAQIGHVFYVLQAKDPDASSKDFLKYGFAEPITAVAKDGRNVNESMEAYKVRTSLDANGLVRFDVGSFVFAKSF